MQTWEDEKMGQEDQEDKRKKLESISNGSRLLPCY